MRRKLNVPADAAEAMKPLAKEYAYLLFAIGLFNASFFAASHSIRICIYRIVHTAEFGGTELLPGWGRRRGGAPW